MGVEITIKNTPPNIKHWSVGVAQCDSGYNFIYDWLTTVAVGEAAVCPSTLTEGSYMTLIRLWENVSGYPATEIIFQPHEHPMEDGKSYVIDWEAGTINEAGGGGEEPGVGAGFGWGWLGLGVLLVGVIFSRNTGKRGA